MNQPATPAHQGHPFASVDRVAALGSWFVRWRWLIVGTWLAAALLGGWVARALPQRLVEGSGPLAGSASQRVEQALRDEFERPFTEPLVWALASERLSVDDPAFRRWVDAAVARLGELAEVRQVLAPPSDGQTSLLRSPGGHRAVLLIELQATELAARERVVPMIRAALAELEARIRREDPTARVALTGRAAATVDNSELNRKQGERAERLALPFTLVVLLLCFGSVGAAALPLAAGLCAMSVAFGLACLLAAVMPVSGLLVNVVKMLGLALGIDYALLMLSHWRARAPQSSLAAALGKVVIEAGGTIAWSGLAVLVGLGGLLFSPLLETRSIGLAGMLVVCVAVLAALTLLPALLVLLGPRLEWPAALAQGLARTRIPGGWAGLARVVTQRPLTVLALAGSASLAIALPGLAARSGFDAGPGSFPAGMESRIGEAIVAEMGRVQYTLPIQVIVRASPAGPVLAQRQALEALVERLAHDPRVALVTPPLLAIDAGLADAALSRDGHALLLQVFAHAGADLAQVQALARDIAWTPPGPALRIDVGGPPVYYADHVAQVEASFAPVLAFVVGASLLLLFVAFRSWLLPVKAVCANLLAVAAGYGAVVAVFQFGWGAGLAGRRTAAGHDPAGRAAAGVLPQFRPVHGLRGLPVARHPARLAAQCRQPRRHGRGPGGHGAGDHRRGGGDGGGLRFLRRHRRGAAEDARSRPGRHRAGRCHADPLSDRAGAGLRGRALELAARREGRPVSPSLASLALLNHQARQRAFSLAAQGGLPEVDHGRPWMPDALAPLSFTHSFAALDARQRLRANQLQALAVTEKFIWFERQLIRIVNAVRRRADLAPPLAQALEHFVAEESKHIAMFERLLQSAEPAWYARPSLRLFRVSIALRGVAMLASWFPRLLLVWVWLAAMAEERTVMLARAYLRSAAGTLDRAAQASARAAPARRVAPLPARRAPARGLLSRRAGVEEAPRGRDAAHGPGRQPARRRRRAAGGAPTRARVSTPAIQAGAAPAVPVARSGSPPGLPARAVRSRCDAAFSCPAGGPPRACGRAGAAEHGAAA